MTARGDWRVSDAERDAVAAELSDHYATGRLTLDEFNARVDAAYRATTRRELVSVTADLPAAARPGPAVIRPDPVAGGAGRTLGTRRRGARARPAVALAVLAGLIAVSVLAADTLPHGGLLVAAFLLLAVPLLMVAGLAAAAVWIGRRAWRKSIWLEAVPLAAGMPWLSRAVWAARACSAGRAYWRAGARAHRRWRRAHVRAGGLSGTTR